MWEFAPHMPVHIWCEWRRSFPNLAHDSDAAASRFTITYRIRRCEQEAERFGSESVVIHCLRCRWPPRATSKKRLRVQALLWCLRIVHTIPKNRLLAEVCLVSLDGVLSWFFESRPEEVSRYNTYTIQFPHVNATGRFGFLALKSIALNRLLLTRFGGSPNWATLSLFGRGWYLVPLSTT